MGLVAMMLSLYLFIRASLVLSLTVEKRGHNHKCGENKEGKKKKLVVAEAQTESFLYKATWKDTMFSDGCGRFLKAQCCENKV